MAENKDCIFCKIANGNIPAAKIWEDKEFLAILDINPNMKGMALVLPKKHFDSYVFDMPKKHFDAFMDATRAVARLLEKAFGTPRVAMVMEGMGVNHAHIKLYPLHGVKEKFVETWAKEKVFFEKYEGYLTTQLGPKADVAELKLLAEEIRKKAQ